MSRARLAAAGALAFTAGKVAGALLASSSLLGVVVQGVIADWGLARVGVHVRDPAAETTSAELAARAGKGASLALAFVAALVTVLLATRAMGLRLGAPSPQLLALGALTAWFSAMRDELLFRGLPLALTRDRGPRVALAAAMALTFAAASSEGWANAVPSALLASVSAALWLSRAGGFGALAFCATTRFAADSVLHGGLFEVEPGAGALRADGALLEGHGAIVVGLVAATLAWFYAARGVRNSHGA